MFGERMFLFVLSKIGISYKAKKYRNPLKGCGMYEKHIFSCPGRHNACPLCMAYDS